MLRTNISRNKNRKSSLQYFSNCETGKDDTYLSAIDSDVTPAWSVKEAMEPLMAERSLLREYSLNRWQEEDLEWILLKYMQL